MTHHRPSFANASATALVRYALGATCLAFVLLPGRMWGEEADNRAYRLAPGDRIAVTVFGQPELSGDVLVDDAGTVTIPLTTPIEVKDLTVVECQRRISERLLSDGILRTASVSVKIAELRPLYVMGDVRQPGAYPFRYGSTAQSAVALAGGFGLGEALRQTAVSEYLVAEERVRQLTLQKRTLLVRKARLEAQRDGRPSFSPPQLGDGADDNDARDIVASEQDIFLAEGNILRGQIDLLRSQKPLLKDQIDANSEQGTAGKKQLDLIRQQIDRYGNLLKQGLGTQNNDFQYRVLEANQEAAVWRLLSDVSRLQVESGNLDFKIKEVEAAFKRQVATELQQTGDHLNELDITLPAAIRIRDVKRQFAGGAAASDSKHPISITRTRNGRAVVLDAEETTPVEPGDVIDVKNEMTHVLPHDEATATPPGSRPAKTDKARNQANAATRIAR
ncbi:polysaccharide biosynthesis/export family protein [Bradyrhizobium sp. NP1]|uniref:polysaccharide biosynthesis/export family protein n=1 Tax=Bradyrhizobium sp. NP1 TaxID=3049772 RepID=UPI0025A4F848|nr:polysaccharide biosynthesis/export family protein [Bradyrhizobium sp. NP1]WJR77324.1 polysaccharide biosynthesis/export family protein [Bradyrhizobium sp. NP1]